MLDEAPRLVHHAQLEAGRLGRVVDPGRDAVQHVEEQRLQQLRIRAHRFEVEDLEPLDAERVVDVIEEVGVAAALDPFARESRSRAHAAAGSPG